MNKLLFALTTINVVAMCWSCTSKDELYKGNFEGNPYHFQQLTKNQLFNQAYSQTLKIKGISNTLHIDSENTSPGYPYAFDTYGDVPHIILDSVSYQYNNTYEDAAKHFAVLYIDPDKFTAADFDRFSGFFLREWPNIKSHVPLSQGYRKLHLVALVYGTDAQFTHCFENGTERIEVWTDGDVNYSPHKGAMQSTNLSGKVQMPGKVIEVETGGQFTIDDLRMFRNKQDRPLELEFELKMKDNIHLSEDTCHHVPKLSGDSTTNKKLQLLIEKINGLKIGSASYGKTTTDLDIGGEGGQATFYRKNDVVVIMEKVAYGETFRSEKDYYFDESSGELIYLMERLYRYNRPIYYDSAVAQDNNDTEAFDDRKTTVTCYHHYFESEKLFYRSNSTGEPEDRAQWDRIGKELMEELEEVHAFFSRP